MPTAGPAPASRAPALFRSWLVVGAALLVGAIAVALTLFLTAAALIAAVLWGLVSLLLRLAPRPKAKPSPRLEKLLEGRRTPEGWVVEIAHG